MMMVMTVIRGWWYRVMCHARMQFAWSYLASRCQRKEQQERNTPEAEAEVPVGKGGTKHRMLRNSEQQMVLRDVMALLLIFF